MTALVVDSTANRPLLDALLDIALDLTAGLSSQRRYERLTAAVRRVVPCDAVALLRYDGDALLPVGADGLAPELHGRRFVVAEHPRLAAIVASRRPVRFAADDPRPDPYDGLVASTGDGHLHVHACMGSALRLDDELVGALTVDALRPGAFDAVDDQLFAAFAALAAATLRTARLIEALEETAERRGQLARQLVDEALERGGAQLLGLSPTMQRLRDELRAAAGSGLTTLVTGETGVGKELVARTLHAWSDRADQALVYVNCAALPESVVESELFGHLRGAFTGAVADRAGKLELAHGGTLFLDEIGELPLSVQPKLLRALQFGELQRVGADQPVHVDLRVVAATNRQLDAEVKAGRFRADLYHRLSVYPIHVPPLRERGDDVLLLAGHLLDRARARLGVASLRLSPGARVALQAYDWPGNVRELEHVLLRGALRASRRGRDGLLLEADLDLGGGPPAPPAVAPAPSSSAADLPTSLGEATATFQRQLIGQTLAASSGNWAEAARRLQIDRANLHRTARRLGLK